MTLRIPPPMAQPLSNDEVMELVADDRAELIVELYGVSFNSEDLHECPYCNVVSDDPADMDDSGSCQDCARMAQEWNVEMDDLRSSYQASVL